MLPELMRTALVAISPNRSKDSWVAGSSVLSQFIQRAPNDIDIHHVNLAAFAEAVDSDTRALADAGFSMARQRFADTELEIVFLRSNGTLAMNWVLEQEQPTALIGDPLFGTRASFADVIARKIKMHFEDHGSKHRDDLLALLKHSASIAAEMSPDQLAACTSVLDLADYDHSGVRGGTP
ncbi:MULTISPECIES: hypothetical protein [Mesorhizobium]|uniref:Uncharacterized protein n=1 Tax=Mesorhizobium neociceri TaxID=1307853 RepID=A0A838B9F9_9HYPH|nr:MULTISPECIES: hypothetical protein [Mesorhizobium]MBA1142304.1 hypothetical protein [Mesorhizobium neociceri]